MRLPRWEPSAPGEVDLVFPDGSRTSMRDRERVAAGQNGVPCSRCGGPVNYRRQHFSEAMRSWWCEGDAR